MVTAAPLLLFTAAARRLSFSTVGFLQSLAPTLQFLLAVFLYGEPFTHNHAISFGLIWAALGLFTVHSVWRARAAARAILSA